MAHLGTKLTTPAPRTSVLALLVCAMESEATPLYDWAKNGGEVRSLGPAKLQILQLEGGEVALLTSGIGLVNAASALTWALTQVSPRYVFSCGSAGGVSLDARVSDVVAGATYRYGDADVRAFDYELGQVPGQPPFFQPDGELLSRFTALPQCLPTGERTVVGHFVSSDRFVTEARAAQLVQMFPTVTTVDMESTALAQVASAFEVPFLSLRGISDLCGPAAQEENYVRAEAAGAVSLRVALHLVGIIDLIDE